MHLSPQAPHRLACSRAAAAVWRGGTARARGSVGRRKEWGAQSQETAVRRDHSTGACTIAVCSQLWTARCPLYQQRRSPSSRWNDRLQADPTYSRRCRWNSSYSTDCRWNPTYSTIPPRVGDSGRLQTAVSEGLCPRCAPLHKQHRRRRHLLSASTSPARAPTQSRVRGASSPSTLRHRRRCGHQGCFDGSSVSGRRGGAHSAASSLAAAHPSSPQRPRATPPLPCATSSTGLCSCSSSSILPSSPSVLPSSSSRSSLFHPLQPLFHPR